MIRKIYESQKKNPVKGDWICQVQSDFQSLGQKIDEELIRNTSDKLFKNEIKIKSKTDGFSNVKEFSN